MPALRGRHHKRGYSIGGSTDLDRNRPILKDGLPLAFIPCCFIRAPARYDSTRTSARTSHKVLGVATTLLGRIGFYYTPKHAS